MTATPAPAGPSILVVDDDTTIRETLLEFLAALGMHGVGAATADDAVRAASEHLPDLVLLDLRVPGAAGFSLLDALRAVDPDLGILVLTGHADVRTAVEAMQRGASDLLEKPVALVELERGIHRAMGTRQLRQEVSRLRSRDREAPAREAGLLSPAPTFDELIALAARNDTAPVLLAGETGTGKGWVARRIHDASPRAAAPFLEINCASLSATLVESELFGHERGAFTDARQAKRGLLEVAGTGTVFLDEIAELGLDVQPKLLKVIEEQRFRRLGGTTELRSQGRLIAATHQPLQALVETRQFRADLFYRLQVLTISLPPLRARREEIGTLARAMLPPGARLGETAVRALEAYDWPGNLRELKNTLWRATILADGAPIEPGHLGLPVSGRATPSPGMDDLSLATAERRAIQRALQATGGNRSKAADLLGIARSTLHEKLKSLDWAAGQPAG